METFIETLSKLDDPAAQRNTLIAAMCNIGKMPWDMHVHPTDVIETISMIKSGAVSLSGPNAYPAFTSHGVNVQQIIQAIKIFCSVDEAIADICMVVFPKG